MTSTDRYDCPITGANAEALAAYQRALDAMLAWRRGADAQLELALHAAPRFVMARVLQAYTRLFSRDQRRVQSARPLLQQAVGLPANDREQRHLAAIAAVIDDHYEGAKATLGELLGRYPQDVLALHAVHALDYLTGDARIHERVRSVLPAWSADMPGYHAVLAMQAFALHESGDEYGAEHNAHAALALNPADTRAHHVLAHVFESTDRADAGMRWMHQHVAAWSTDTVASIHCWWHVALFHLAQGDADGALALYDRRIRAESSAELSDLIDAAALLWRIALAGGNAGTRWIELANAWEGHMHDGFCSFSDLHAMLAFVGARDWTRAQALERTLAAAQHLPTRHGWSTRHLGLPACRALMAFGRGDSTLAITLLASLPALAYRLGGSHAQRDVLHLTLLNAVERVRRPARRRSVAVPAE